MPKKAASWTIDEDILAWIGGKLGSKSEFVNNILRKARIKEEEVKVIRNVMCNGCHQIHPETQVCMNCEGWKRD